VGPRGFTKPPDLPQRPRLALEYADRVSATPVDVPDEFFASLQRLFSEREIVELTTHIAHENYNAKSNRPLRVEANNFCEIPFPQAKV
jgi:alkylhydroperoxidase family enzyme